MRTLSTISIFLIAAAAGADDYPQRAQDETIVETVLRLDNFDLNSSEKGKAAVLRYLQHNPGSDKFLELVRKYNLPEANDLLLKLASDQPTETAGVDAARLLLDGEGRKLLQSGVDKNDAASASLVQAIGLTGRTEAAEMLLPLLTDARCSLAVRSAAATGIGRQPAGQKKLLELAADGKLPADLSFTVANILHASPDAGIRESAAKYLTLPATAGATPLPPLGELVKKNGDAAQGRAIFGEKGTCIKCHKVAGAGKDVGPDLSEIGSKLTREAMFVAILDPSAGISHNYESYQAILVDGTLFSGLKVSETDDAVTLRSAEGIERAIPRDDIDELIKQKISLMPADLQKLMTVDELVDVVAYLATLKKPE